MFLVIITCAIEFDHSLGPGILFRVMASMVKADEKVPSGIFFPFGLSGLYEWHVPPTFSPEV